jgi:hypothetical protein
MHPGCTIEAVYLYREPIDFRKAINGLSTLVEQELGLSPFASALYVFTNRPRNKIQKPCTGTATDFACGKSDWRQISLPGRRILMGLLKMPPEASVCRNSDGF